MTQAKTGRTVLVAVAAVLVVALLTIRACGDDPSRVRPETTGSTQPGDDSPPEKKNRRRTAPGGPSSPGGTAAGGAADSDATEAPGEPLPSIADPIQGRFLVVDDHGRPVEGARLAFGQRPWTRAAHLLVTGEGGRAKGDLDRSWRGVATADGFAPCRVRPRRDETVRVVLHRALAIAGVVVDSSGAPVPGATVRVDRASLPDVEARTDADGTFRLEGLGPERDVSVCVDGGGLTAAMHRVVPGMDDLRVVAHPRPAPVPPRPRSRRASFARLLVVRADGSVVPGTRVGGLAAVSTCDATGTATLELPLPVGAWVSLGVTAPVDQPGDPPRVRHVRVCTLETPTGEPTRFEIPAATPVRVTVVGEFGPLTPREGAVVRFQFREMTWDPDQQAFVGEALRAGRHWIAAAAPGYANAVDDVTAVLGRSNEFTIRPDRGVRVFGSLEGDTRGVAIHVGVHLEDGVWWGAVQGPAEDGSWEVKHLPGGEVDLLVTRRSAAVVQRHFVLAPGDTHNTGMIRVPEPSWVRGVVRDAGGEPLGGCRIETVYVALNLPGPRTATSPDGTFELPFGGLDGSVLRVSRPGSGTEHVTLPAGAAGGAVTATLRPGGDVRLIYRRRGSVTSWWVEEVDGPGSWQPREKPMDVELPPDHSGHLFTDLPAGPLAIVVSRHDEVRRVIEVRAGGTVEVRFE